MHHPIYPSGKLAPSRPQLVRLGLETLEDRLVMSANGPMQSLTQVGTEARVALVSSDTRVDDQWALNNSGQQGGKVGADIRAASAWDVTTGSTRTIVSVMDTGIDYTHKDLYLNIWLNQGEIPATRKANLRDIDGDGLITFRDLNNSVNQGVGKITDLNRNGFIDGGDLLNPMVKDRYGRDTGNGGWEDGISQDGDSYVDDLVGWNFVKNTNDPMDDYSHGTHVAGTIGAIGNNREGVSGIAWQVQLMAIKFMDQSGVGGLSQFVAGLNYAVAKGAKISNNSWTGASTSTDLQQAIDRARAAGHIFVAAAGNYGSNNDVTPTYPASFASDNIVSVGSSDRQDRLSSFSNYGANSVDLVAPGSDILSTMPGGGYGTKSGTSMATPHVVGVLALVWSQHPTWTYKQVINQVLSTVDRLPALANTTRTGGRLNAAAAVGAAQVASVSRVNVVSAISSGPAANTLSRIRVTFARSMKPKTFTGADVRLTAPNGSVISITGVTVVPGTGDKTYDITFPTQYAAGTYQLSVGPEVFDLAGTKMVKYTTAFRLAPAVVMTSYTNIAIPPRGRGVALLTIDDNVKVGKVTVKINIKHPKTSDLYIHLQAPDGTSILLVNRKGGTSANFTDTVFDDASSDMVGFGRGPFTGSYLPEVALSNLIGKTAKGTWKLWIEDRGGVNRGTLLNWSVSVQPQKTSETDSGIFATEALKKK